MIKICFNFVCFFFFSQPIQENQKRTEQLQEDRDECNVFTGKTGAVVQWPKLQSERLHAINIYAKDRRFL